jgi:hypothetical protein
LGELKDILLNFGAIAGFAGIIGLAVLAMLYFSQARDVRRLREWAGREPERAIEVELRAQQIASQAIAQAYEAMPASTPPPAEEAAPVPVAAESAATEPESAEPDAVEPDAVEPESAEPESAEPDPDATQAHDVVAEEFGETVLAADAAPDATVVKPAPEADEEELQAPPPPPSDPAGEPPKITPQTAAASRSAVPLPPLPPLDTSEFAAVRTPAPTIPDYYSTTGTTGSGTFEALELEPERRSRVPFAVAGVLVAVFAVILIGTQLLGGDDSSTSGGGTGGSAANRPSKNTADRSPRINRAAVTVAVLNGTTTQGIARAAADGLNKAGFTDTTTGNLADGKAHPTTIVYYAPGSRSEAEEVAKELAVSDVKPATDEVIAQGGSVPVIVVLGANFQQ